ncbi:hypothetical protein EDB89DRAFT_1914424 [Lactarius sanguifluus]|nr:hypothetical protein EDB89DRAFT_1914424 [Lactarius sanguifluus]
MCWEHAPSACLPPCWHVTCAWKPGWGGAGLHLAHTPYELGCTQMGEGWCTPSLPAPSLVCAHPLLGLHAPARPLLVSPSPQRTCCVQPFAQWPPPGCMDVRFVHRTDPPFHTKMGGGWEEGGRSGVHTPFVWKRGSKRGVLLARSHIKGWGEGANEGGSSICMEGANEGHTFPVSTLPLHENRGGGPKGWSVPLPICMQTEGVQRGVLSSTVPLVHGVVVASSPVQPQAATHDDDSGHAPNTALSPALSLFHFKLRKSNRLGPNYGDNNNGRSGQSGATDCDHHPANDYGCNDEDGSRNSDNCKGHSDAVTVMTITTTLTVTMLTVMTGSRPTQPQPACATNHNHHADDDKQRRQEVGERRPKNCNHQHADEDDGRGNDAKAEVAAGGAMRLADASVGHVLT